MKSLIVCVSTSHGNTRRIADRMAELLDAEVVEPESVDPEMIREYDLVGFGSGIYYMAVHARLRNLILRLRHADGVRAFTFFTSGAREIPLMDYTKSVRKLLGSKGFKCSTPFPAARVRRWAIPVHRWDQQGTVERPRPGSGVAFAAGLHKRVARSQAAS
jgi:flavodoxin